MFDNNHRDVQLILAYSWARPSILIAGKGKGGMFISSVFFLLYSYSSFFPVALIHLLYYLFCLFSPILWETIQNDPQEDVSLNSNAINQSMFDNISLARAGEWGTGGRGNLGVIVVRVCEPLFPNLPHSYT